MGNFYFAKISREFCTKFFPRRTKKTAKYGLKAFNDRKQNLNRILIMNLLLLATNCDTKTDGIAHITSKTV